ncbi:uncharacterized protein [Rutidosis leptorrhynchoides]|uniref:uncharacterized protein n=1 Tax=Rutidosis leptorrhynchoides TaxID=125765 RepID=UPI003A99E410
MSKLLLFRLKSIWGNSQFDYAVTLSRGFFGGIISIWDPLAFVKECIWCDDNFLIIKGRWIREEVDVFMVNVYAPQSIVDKVAFWNKLSLFKASNVGDYILFGDWNVVRLESERCGSEFYPIDAQFFNDFIVQNSLYKIPLGGLQFTYRNKAENKMSKLDRFFVTNNVLSVVDELKGIVMPRGSSDHSPVSIFQEKVDFGPTYLKVFASWFDRADFEDTVRNAWAVINVDQNLPFVCKMRRLKGRLKTWILNARLHEASRLKEAIAKIEEIDVMIDSGTATNDDVSEHNFLCNKRDELSKLKSLDLLQKSRIKWDIEGTKTLNSFTIHLNINVFNNISKV